MRTPTDRVYEYMASVASLARLANKPTIEVKLEHVIGGAGLEDSGNERIDAICALFTKNRLTQATRLRVRHVVFDVLDVATTEEVTE